MFIHSLTSVRKPFQVLNTNACFKNTEVLCIEMKKQSPS